MISTDPKNVEHKIEQRIQNIKNQYPITTNPPYNKKQKKKLNKKLRALKEFFFSEISYINDLNIWEKDFRKEILNMKCIPNKDKYFLNEHLFTNLAEIINIHTQILGKLKSLNYQLLCKHNKQNNIEILSQEKYEEECEFVLPLDCDIDCNLIEYASLYITNFTQATNFYLEYIKFLPYSIYEFERISKSNKEFAKEVHNWLLKHKLLQLGVNNFFFRPLTKASRYPILFKAIKKHELNKVNIKLYDEVLEGLENANDLNDLVYSSMQTYLNVYNFMNLITFRLKSQNIFALNLMDKRTKINFNQEVIVKKTIIQFASLKNVVILNTVLLICELRKDQFEKIVVDTEPLFLSKCLITKERLVFFEQADRLEKYWPIYLLQKETLNIKGFYFTDEFSRNATYEKFKLFIKEAQPYNTNHDFNIKRLEEEISTEDNKIHFILEHGSTDIRNISTIYEMSTDLNFEYKGNSREEEVENIPEIEKDVISFKKEKNNKYSKTNKDVQSSDIEWKPSCDLKNKYVGNVLNTTKILNSVFPTKNEEEKKMFEQFYKNKLEEEQKEQERETKENITDSDIYDEEKFSKNLSAANCLSLFTSPGVFYFNFKFSKVEFPGENKKIKIFSSEKGIFKILNGETIKLWNQPAKKIIFDAEHQLLLYQIKDKLYISSFSAESTNLNPREINIEIYDFFFGKDSNSTTIILCTKGDYSFTLLYLLNILVFDDYVSIKFQKNLYVGSNINDIIYFRKKLIVAGKSFEIVDIQTLRIQDFLETYDVYTNSFLNAIDNKKAKTIFQINNDTFLMCFNGVGFYVDATGNLKYTHIHFTWEETGNEFRIYRRWVIVISSNYISFFNLNSGEIEFCKGFKNGKFVSNSEQLKFFNDTGIYTIEIMTKDKEKAYIQNKEVETSRKASLSTVKNENKRDFSKNANSDDLVIKKQSKAHVNSKRKFNTWKKLPKKSEKEEKDTKIYLNQQTGTFESILNAYQEKYKNYRLISLKLVDQENETSNISSE